MTFAADIDATKTEHGENFPVASFLITPSLRAPILSFYRFARAADDVADHHTLSESDKFARLDALEDTLLGRAENAKAALPLRRVLAETGFSPTHPLDLLTAFRADVIKRRYANWAELMEYCRYSAMPVGRFVLDLHGEAGETWIYSDPLCAGLQVINHVQDCAKDYRALDRVYLPLDMLEAQGTGVEALAASEASPALRACLAAITRRTGDLISESAKLSLAVKDTRLGLETGIIVRLAHRLIELITTRDPLRDRVHLTKAGAALEAMQGAAATLAARLARPSPSSVARESR
jgi:squalene synthase HpnC